MVYDTDKITELTACPRAVTHSFNMSRRGIELAIIGVGVVTIDMARPLNANSLGRSEQLLNKSVNLIKRDFKLSNIIIRDKEEKRTGSFRPFLSHLLPVPSK